VSASRFSTVMVYASQRYTLHPGGDTTVQELAQYLAQYEPYIDSLTLEAAFRIQPNQRLGEINRQAGDRLVLFTHAAQQVQLPDSGKAGDKVLVFAKGRLQRRAGSQSGVLAGKPDDSEQVVPDVDLREFVSQENVEYVSRGCIWFSFDVRQNRWYASRMGKTRIFIDELELSLQKIPVDTIHRLRLYREMDDPQSSYVQPIADLTIRVETARQMSSSLSYQQGSQHVHIYVGTERSRQTIQVSDNIAAGQIMTSLSQYNRLPLTDQSILLLMRLLKPDETIADYQRQNAAFLYAARQLRQAQTTLLLRDIHHRHQTYTLMAGQGDEILRIGSREGDAGADQALAVDIRPVVSRRGYDPDMIRNLSRFLAKVQYQPTDNSWWLWLDEESLLPVYLNNTRLTTTIPIQITSGDVLSFGSRDQHYLARLEAAIISQ